MFYRLHFKIGFNAVCTTVQVQTHATSITRAAGVVTVLSSERLSCLKLICIIQHINTYIASWHYPIYIDSETSSFSAAITLEPKDLRSHAAILHATLVLFSMNILPSLLRSDLITF